MLVLTRTVGEKIVVGGPCVITLVDVDRGKVRIGVDAPASVPIMRIELLSPEELAKAMEKTR